MTTTLAPAPVFRQWDNNGNPLVNGQLFTYAAGTSTPLASYQDSTGLNPNSNPVILNSRGEAQVWLQPNTAYKLVLQDSSGNQLWAVDQIINAQLITLYGGVDVGVSNAYILNFTAPFTALTDGIIIYWIPSNTNSTASTLNVNGLGVIPLVNPDGSALRAGEITANQITAVMYKGGNFFLIQSALASQVIAVPGTVTSPSITFQGDPTSGFYFSGTGQIGLSLGGVGFGVIWTGQFAGSLTGVSGTVNFSGNYRQMGPYMQMQLPQVSGTSNATSFSAIISTPAVRPNVTSQWISVPALQDNGTALYSQVGTVAPSMSPGLTVITFYKNGSQLGWTASGTKGIGDGGAGQSVNTITFALF